jgi:16S rRNA (uracil1498-N3)-methyltransferase
MSEKPATRLFVESDLAEGAVVGLSPDHAHFLRSVLRLEPGRWVTLFNGRDGEWSARIDGIGKGWASLAVGDHLRTQTSCPDVWLYFAPIKRARLDFLVQKATELGVRRIQPVVTQRTIVERVKGDRLSANVTEAAEQCERLDLPEICEPVRLDRALNDHPEGRTLVACVEFGDARPIAEVVSELPPGAPVTLLVGPEGGFTPEERALLENRTNARFAGLGPRILRAETAGLAALTVWQALAGDWAESPPKRA